MACETLSTEFNTSKDEKINYLFNCLGEAYKIVDHINMDPEKRSSLKRQIASASYSAEVILMDRCLFKEETENGQIQVDT